MKPWEHEWQLGETARRQELAPATLEHYARALALAAGAGEPETRVLALLTEAERRAVDQDWESAEGLLLGAIAWAEAELREHPLTAAAHARVGELYSVLVLDRQEPCEQHFVKAIALAERTLGPEHLATATYLGLLGSELRFVDEVRAEALLVRALPLVAQHYGKEHPIAAALREELDQLYRVQDRVVDRALLSESRRAWPAFSTREPGPSALPRLETIGPHNAARLECVHTLAGNASACSVAFSPDDKLIAVGTNGGVTLYHRGSFEVLGQLECTAEVLGLAFDPAGAFLVTGAGEHATLWSLADGRFVRRILARGAFYVALSPDGALLATVAEGAAQLARVSDGAALCQLATTAAGSVERLAFSPDGALLAVVSEHVTLWRTSDGALVHALEPRWPGGYGVAFAPSGEWLVTSHGWVLHRWSTSGALERTFDGKSAHGDAVLGLAMNPAGTLFASGSWDTNLGLWDPESERAVASLQLDERVKHLAFDGSGTLLATVSERGRVRFWGVRAR